MSTGARKQRNYRRNLRRRALLVSLGFTEEEARWIVWRDGKMVDELRKQRDQEDARRVRELRAAIRAEEAARYPTQPKQAQSVRAVPVAFETNRRRH
jgi:hypothetical protein